MPKLLSAVALAALLAPSLALANACPVLIAEIDEALPEAELADEERARVEELRATGEEAHAAGDHAASMEALEEAKEILGL